MTKPTEQMPEPLGRVEHNADTSQYGIIYTHTKAGTLLYGPELLNRCLKAEADNARLLGIGGARWMELMNKLFDVEAENTRLSKALVDALSGGK